MVQDLVRLLCPHAARSLVKGYGPGLLAPVSQLIPAKGSPLGIYYTGDARFGNAFAQDLGELFEAYVGRQLGLLPDAMVHSEIVYGQNQALSVDSIISPHVAGLVVGVLEQTPQRPHERI